MGDKSKTPRPRYPRDWSNNLLTELSTLASITKDDFASARQVLSRVVDQEVAGPTGPQYLMPYMVELAIEKCRAAPKGHTAGPSPQETRSEGRSVFRQQSTVTEAGVSTLQQAPTPSVSRSPTLQPQQQQRQSPVKLELDPFTSSQPDLFPTYHRQDMDFEMQFQEARVKRWRIEVQRQRIEVELMESRLEEMKVVQAR